MLQRTPTTPQFVRLLQLAATLLAVVYMLLIGGTFDATVRFRVQLMNTALIGGAAILWLTLRLRQRAQVSWTGLELPLAAFVSSQWIAAATSAQARLSLEFAAGVTGWALAFLILCDLLAHGWPASFMRQALVLAAALIAAEGVVEVAAWLGQWLQLGQLPPVAFRLNGLLGQSNLTAGVLNLLLPVVLARLLLAESRRGRFALSVLAAGILTAEFFTSSRGGWVGGIVTLSVFASLTNWRFRHRLAPWLVRWRGWPLAVRGASILGTLATLIAGAWLLGRQSLQITHSSLLSGREVFWRAAWINFLSAPLTGAGPNLYAWLYPRTVSVPPGWLPPHAHSLFLEVLSGSGLLGLLGVLALVSVGGARLWRQWKSSSEPESLWRAAYLSGLAGLGVHQIFDYLLDTPAVVFVLVIVCALAFAPLSVPPASSRRFPAIWLVAPMLVVLGTAILALRGAALNDMGLQLAAQKRWAEAAALFQRAAQVDPAFPLYTEEAAQAAIRAGNNVEAAVGLWQRAAEAEPNWAIPRAAAAVLARNAGEMDAAARLAPGSDLMALNAGVLWEAAGNEAKARERFRQVLDLQPGSARALFWAQTSLRAAALAEWQAARPPDESALGQGWASLAAGRPEQALELFRQAHDAAPLDTLPYIGMARAAWAVANEPLAEQNLRAAQVLPVAAIQQKIEILLLEGDWEAAHGDQAGAREAYTLVFSAVNDYTSEGQGTYGYPRRSWIVFHRDALPTDLIPQFAHADITPEMDAAIARAAQWFAADGQMGTTCYMLQRVYREAPASTSGELWAATCR